MSCQSHLETRELDLELTIQNHKTTELVAVSVTSTDKVSSCLSFLSLWRIHPLKTSFRNIMVNTKTFYLVRNAFKESRVEYTENSTVLPLSQLQIAKSPAAADHS